MDLKKAAEGFLLDAQSGGYSPAYIPTIKSQLQRITAFFGDRDLETITLQDWKEYIHWLRHEYQPKRFNGDASPLSEATIDNHWKMIRSFYNWATDNTILSTQRPDIKLPRPKYQSPQIVPFTPEEVKRLLDASQFTQVQKQSGRAYKIKRPHADRDKTIIMILLDTGVRLGELHRLRCGDINLENGEIYIRPHASSRKSMPRTVHIGARTKQAIWKYIAQQQSAGDQSHPLFDLKPASIRIFINRIGANAKIAHCHPHKFRHTFAIMYLRNGGDVFTLQRLLGHATLQMTLKYVALAQTDMAQTHMRASPVDNWKL
jgi:integrase/recombinase XerD